MGVPDPEGAQYLLDALFEVGPTKPGEYGEIPIGWTDIAAYKAATGAISERWEMTTLRQMSMSYMRGKQHGEDVMNDPPEPDPLIEMDDDE